jgi:two-component system, response regulator / RNA-binding antiterminator
MDLIVVADSLERSQPLLKAAGKAGYRIAKLVGPDDQIAPYPEAGSVGAMVIICDEIADAQLRAMRSIAQTSPMPVLVLTNDDRHDSILAAVKAGASSYVIEYTDLSRLEALLRVATVRYQQNRLLTNELETMRTALVQRKIIEKAKGIIMKQRNIDEDDAYKAIRQLAMNHNKKIGEVAGQIVTAAEVLL